MHQFLVDPRGRMIALAVRNKTPVLNNTQNVLHAPSAAALRKHHGIAIDKQGRIVTLGIKVNHYDDTAIQDIIQDSSLSWTF